MPFITSSDGCRLTYSLVGDGDPLLLHLGGGYDASLWDAAGYVKPLAERYQCILFDHRGHGESDRPVGPVAHHVDRYVADIIELLDHLGFQRTFFWGYSNGLSAGIRLAYRFPARLYAIVGTGTAVYEPGDTPESIRDWVKARLANPQPSSWEPLIERFDAQEPDGVPHWMKERIRVTDRAQADGWTAGLADWDWSDWHSLSELTVPVLFVTGELEDPTDDMGTAVAMMARGQQLRLAGQGHINAFLRSDLVLPTVLEFLQASRNS